MKIHLTSILVLIASTSSLIANGKEKPNKDKQAATVAVAGEIQGYWGMCGDIVACLEHPTSKCVEVVVKPKPNGSYQQLSCSELIHEAYTNSNFINKVELHLHDGSGGITVTDISAYTVSNVCNGKSLSYTEGSWNGIYSGSINLNTCILQ